MKKLQIFNKLNKKNKIIKKSDNNSSSKNHSILEFV